jgi:nucleotide-binding universal stress UspA family protein
MKSSKLISKQNTADKPKQIWWAVNLLQDNRQVLEHGLQSLLPHAKALNAMIVPVCYIDPYKSINELSHNFPLFPVLRDSTKSLKDRANSVLLSIGKKTDRAYLSEAIYLTHSEEVPPTLRDKVLKLSSKAKSSKAVFVALSSHGYTGLKRLYMGSFTETYTQLTKGASLVLNPNSRVASKIKRIIFATDFSQQSLSAFDSLLQIYGKANVKITVVHYLARYETEAAKSNMKKFEKQFVANTKKHGVSATFKLLNQTGEFAPSKEILSFTSSLKADLIALTAQSGELKSLILGALSREILRYAKLPVLLFRS